MKYRNCFGKLEPSIGLYFVQKSSGGKYKICKKEGKQNGNFKDDRK